MFSLTRRRREAERNKKLEDVFREADANGNGKITQEQMIKIFEVNDCAGKEYVRLEVGWASFFRAWVYILLAWFLGGFEKFTK
jgi:hypothetical protein